MFLLRDRDETEAVGCFLVTTGTSFDWTSVLPTRVGAEARRLLTARFGAFGLFVSVRADKLSFALAMVTICADSLGSNAGAYYTAYDHYSTVEPYVSAVSGLAQAAGSVRCYTTTAEE